ncbi:hypothetical protein [Yoonia sp. 2307UL14-13]|uniref:hypothetical protein n=1 Tax=Yoonia sp. 2307UL14-13 TaxID=3126506 RepID=UPI0030A2CA9B
MAERHQSQNHPKNPEKDKKVPGAHGKGDDFDKGISGVSRVRGDHEDIPLTEDAAND